MIAEILLTKIGEINALCHNYYRNIQSEELKNDVMNLITWIGLVAIDQYTTTIDEVLQRFSIADDLDEIRNSLIDIVVLLEEFRSSQDIRIEFVWSWNQYSTKKCKTMDELIEGLLDGSIEQPKVGFDQPRVVTIMPMSQFTPELLKRAYDDEIDSFQQYNLSRVILVEPSMVPAYQLILDDIDIDYELDENVIIEKIEQCRLSLVRQLIV